MSFPINTVVLILILVLLIGLMILIPFSIYKLIVRDIRKNKKDVLKKKRSDKSLESATNDMSEDAD